MRRVLILLTLLFSSPSAIAMPQPPEPTDGPVDPREEVPLPEGSAKIRPIVGLRFGALAGGPLSGAFLEETELGVSLQGALGLVLKVGLVVGEQDELKSLKGNTHLGPGVYEASTTGVRVGVEARYRLLLDDDDMAVSLDVVAGVQYGGNHIESQGPAFHSNDPSCDPTLRACALQLVSRPDDVWSHSFGASLGLDLHWGAFVAGYRMLPDFLGVNQPTTHQLTFGVTAF